MSIELPQVLLLGLLLEFEVIGVKQGCGLGHGARSEMEEETDAKEARWGDGALLCP